MEKCEAVIFDIQRFSVHDGPGIRTLVFMKGCEMKCLWCSNPEGQASKPQLMLYPEKCIGCLSCAKVCPTGAAFTRDGLLLYDNRLCIGCGKCAEVCPAEAKKIAGQHVTVEHVVTEVLKDRLFYRNSGGGVTFGGGEPTLYPEFIRAVAIECQNRGINVAIETCGYAPWGNFEKLVPHINLVMFDLKHMDANTHKKLCGQSSRLIVENLKRLCELQHRIEGLEILIRMPIIPGLNDSKDNIHATAKFISSLGSSISGVELLPYHKLGISKYERLGVEYQIAEVKIPDNEHMNAIRDLLQQHGLNVEVS